jgi:anti-sigma factor RsiW
MRHLDEGTIHAWLDGALSADEAARAEAHVASCTVCAEAVAEARGLIAASTRILTALDDVPAGVVPGTRRETRPRLFVSWLVRERIAAVVAVIVAGGALAVALSRDAMRPASLQTASEPVQGFELMAADSPAPAPVPAAQPARIGESPPGAHR